MSSDGKEYSTIKGDDIGLAIDMLKDAYENKYDVAILISGDGDFKELVEVVKKKGKMVENFHFQDTVSYALLKVCNSSTLINKKTVNKFKYKYTEKYPTSKKIKHQLLS